MARTRREDREPKGTSMRAVVHRGVRDIGVEDVPDAIVRIKVARVTS
jgi:hypothetical protein